MSGYFQRLAHRATSRKDLPRALTPGALRSAFVEPVRDPFEAVEAETQVFARRPAPKAMSFKPVEIEGGVAKSLERTVELRKPDAIPSADPADRLSLMPVAQREESLEHRPTPVPAELSAEPPRIEVSQLISPPEQKRTTRPDQERATPDAPVMSRETERVKPDPGQEPQALQRIEESLRRLMSRSDAQVESEETRVSTQQPAPLDVPPPVLNPMPLLVPRETGREPVEEAEDAPRLVIGQVRVDVASAPRQIEREIVRVEQRVSPGQSRRGTGSATKLQFGLGQM